MLPSYPHKPSCPSFYETASSLPKPQTYHQGLLQIREQQNNYLSGVNYQLMNTVNETESEKNFYRNRLTQEYHSHHSELEEAFQSISDKNGYIIDLEEQLDRLNKDFRILSDDYVTLKNSTESDKQIHQQELQKLKAQCEYKIKQMEEQAVERNQKSIKRRVSEVQRQCQARVEMYKGQISQLTENSTQLTHELKMLQQEHRNMLIRNDTLIQESIQRELRKRDFDAQNNHLSDLAQYDFLKKEKANLKEELKMSQQEISGLRSENKQLRAELQIAKAKLKDIEAAFESEKSINRVSLEEKHKYTEEFETNTEQQYVPVIMPVDTNIVGEVVSLRDFLVEKMIQKYVDFFAKAATKQKKKSASLITFKNCLSEVKQTPQNSLLLHLHTGFERIIKLYCPAMNYSREFLTVKDQFIRKTLMEAEGISNKQQKLYRLLELIHRLQHPIIHLKSQVSSGELKTVELKIMATLRKIFTTK